MPAVSHLSTSPLGEWVFWPLASAETLRQQSIRAQWVSASPHRQSRMLSAIPVTTAAHSAPASASIDTRQRRQRPRMLAAISPGNAPFAQVVGGKLHLHPISRHHTHKIQANFA